MNTLRTLILFLALTVLTGAASCACATTSSDLPTRSISARDSFVKLNVELVGIELGVASGVIIGADDNGTYILTAGHFCENNGTIVNAFDIDMNKFETSIEKVSGQSDLCLLKSLKVIDRPSVLFAGKMPVPGSKVHNLAAPLGIHGYRMILQFEGFYSGRVFHPNGYYLDMHTVPTKPGSSGSPTFNDRWELIGITSMAINSLESVGMMVTLEDIHCFLGSSADIKCPTVPTTAEGGASKLLHL